MAGSEGYNYGRQVGAATIRQLGGKVTPEKLRFFDAWAKAEGTKAAYNPFATTKKGYPGETQFNPVGVKNYRDLQTGIKATVDTLQLNYYTEIVNLLRSGDATAEQLATAVAKSPWGTGTGVLRVLGVHAADGYEQVKSTAKYGQNVAQLEQQYQKQSLLDYRPSGAYLGMLEQNPALQPLTGLARGFEPIRQQSPGPPQVAAPVGEGALAPTPTGGYAGFTGDIDLMPGNSVGARAVKMAATQLGDPYVFGASSAGKDPQSFDCSSLVQWAYRQVGVDIPRDTYGQQAVLKPKSWSDLQVGDPIYRRSGGHVVIYAGNGKVIAAPHTGTDVQYQDLEDFSQDEYVPYMIPGGNKKAAFGVGPKKKGKKLQPKKKREVGGRK